MPHNGYQPVMPCERAGAPCGELTELDSEEARRVEIGPTSRIGDLVSDYPYLEDFFVTYHAALTRLTNPLLKRTIDRNATLADAAEMADVAVDTLVADVREEVAAHPAREAPSEG